MATTRPFAYNTGTTIQGTTQTGSLAVGVSAQDYSANPGGVKWWMGPDEDLGYVIADTVPTMTQPTNAGVSAGVGFYRSTALTDQAFIVLVNGLPERSGLTPFIDSNIASTWLINNGLWHTYSAHTEFVSISASAWHSIGLNTNNTILGWGLNSSGQLGDNTILNRYTPVAVAGLTKPFYKIAAGYSHTLGLDNNGKAWAWGYNSYGQVGVAGFTCKLTPMAVMGSTKTFCSVSASLWSSFGIDKMGKVWGWGYNGSGVLGDNTITSRLTPVAVSGTTKTFCSISGSMGSNHVLCIDKNGKAWAWGNNSVGQLGNNTITNRSTPVAVSGTTKTFCSISAGNGFSMGIDKNGKAWGWGYNVYGAVGDNTITSRLTPVAVSGTTKTFCSISAGFNFSLAIDKYGKAWAWGRNDYGKLGNNIMSSVSTPVAVMGITKTFCSISVGNQHVIAIDKNGKAWAWGYNSYGELGNNYNMYNYSPTAVSGVTKTFCSISAGNDSSLALDKNSKAWGWGYNGHGELGNNNILPTNTPMAVSATTKTFCKILIGETHSLALDKNGNVWSWGQNNYGGLGNNTIISKLTPVAISGTTKTFCKIGAGYYGSLALDKNGKIWGWGLNSSGQLGDNTTISKLTPVAISGTTKTFCNIIASRGSSSFGIDKNNKLWAWGANYWGQLGDNTITDRSTPVAVSGTTKTFCSISGGARHSVGVDKNGKAWGWGYNVYGAVGDNTITSRLTPVAVSGTTKTFCSISAGSNFSLAIDKNGKAWAWGRNEGGQLGDSSAISKRTPVAVVGTTKTFCSISAGSNFSLAIDKYGKAWGWGYNGHGELGTFADSFLFTPKRIYL